MALTPPQSSRTRTPSDGCRSCDESAFPLLLVALVFAGAMPAQAAAPLSRVQVVALEFHYRLSRVRIPSGPVRIELANFGQDEHDLQLQRVGGSTV